jgi:hypothetical protein
MAETIQHDDGRVELQSETDAPSIAFAVLSLDNPARRAALTQFFDGRCRDAIFQEYAVGIVEKHLTGAGLEFKRSVSHRALDWVETCWYISRDLYEAVTKVEHACVARETFAELIDFCLLTDGNVPWRIAVLLDLYAVGLLQDKYILPDRIIELLPGRAKAELPEMRKIFDEWIKATAEREEEDYRTRQYGY